MPSFLAETENIKKKEDQNDRNTIAGKWQIKTVGNCYSQFPSKRARVELSCSWQKIIN